MENNMVYEKITSKARQRMKLVLKWRKRGRTFEEIGRDLKVTRERVRQLEKLAGYMKAKDIL